MSAAGIDIANQSFEGGSNATTPTPEELIASGIVPEGATYTSADGTVYNAGDTMPTSQYLDAFRYGDYTYVYSADYINEPYTVPFENQFYNNNYNGWLVTIRQETSDGTTYGYQLKKENYDAILSNINGVDVTSMTHTFSGCTALITAPAIPSSVTDMTGTFIYCDSLTTAPTIPGSVIDMGATFSGCTALTTAPDMSKANSVTNMSWTFYGCTAFTDLSDLAIPSSVTNMQYTFSGCKALTTAPAIPSTVTDMQFTFDGCTSLTGNVEINATPTSYRQCFYNTTKSIKIIGSCGNKAKLAATAKNGNVTY